MHSPFTDIEAEIANYMLRFAKFEFFLLSTDPALGTPDNRYNPARISLDWQKVAQRVEHFCPFHTFNPQNSGFTIFFEQAPQYLTFDTNNCLKWDSDNPSFDSWHTILIRGLLQFRNNIAHGNKGYLPAPFTADRTDQFIASGHVFMDFLSKLLFDSSHWESDVYFQ